MATHSKSRLAPVLVAGVMLLTCLGSYLGGYCLLPARDVDQYGAQHVEFSANWQCLIYSPVARLEAAVRGIDLFLYGDGPQGWGDYLYDEDSP